MDHDFHMLRRIILDFLDFDFPLLIGGHNAVDQPASGCTIRDFCNGQRLFIALLYFCPDADSTTALAFIVGRAVGQAAG